MVATVEVQLREKTRSLRARAALVFSFKVRVKDVS